MFVEDGLVLQFLESCSSSYYEISDFNSNCKDSGLLIIHQNIRSFNKNFDSFSVFINSINRNIDIIVLTETWFIKDFCSSIRGFTDHHVFRPDKIRGGVSIYIRNGLICNAKRNLTFVEDGIEMCAVELFPNNMNLKQSLIIAGVYRPPNSPVHLFNDKINEILSTHLRKPSMLAGDFNIDLLELEVGTDFVNVMQSNSFYPLINIPTRITNISSKCLDHMWYNKFNVDCSGSFKIDITDHYPIFSILSYVVNNKPLSRKFRDHSDCCIDSLSLAMDKFFNEYNTCVMNRDVNSKTSWVCRELFHIYNKSCPVKIKNVSMKKLLKPWITHELQQLIEQKHRMFKQYKNNMIPFDDYNRFKNYLTRKLKSAKSDFYTLKFRNNSFNVKKNWQTVNSILNRRNKSFTPNVVINEGVEVNDPTKVSDLFLDYFSTIATELDDSIPISDIDPLHYMPAPILNSFFVNPASSDEVESILMSFENKSCSLDFVPVFIFKKFSHYLSPIICDIFNSSISVGIFPEILKVSRITPVYKSNDVKIRSNFRPIALLSTISKAIEKLMKTRVDKFVDANDILYDKQFGFRSGYNTSDAILEFVDRCTSSLDNREYFIAIFLDLSKAFDTVNRDILIDKLSRMGIRGRAGEWIGSYLTDRKIYVNLNNCNSRTATMNIGVPQGSVSAPWLFSLYVNDMHRSAERLSFLHFADDTTIFRSGNNLSQLCNEINEDLRDVSSWLIANRLSLNVNKTKFMLFTHSPVDINSVQITINNSIIAHVDNIKFLGVTIDSRLNFNIHINLLSKRLSCVIGIVRKLSTIVPYHVLKMLYYSLFHSHLIYGIQVWGGCGVTNRLKIIRLQEKVVSLCFDQEGNYPLNFHHTYLYFILSFLHKCINNDHNLYFLNKTHVLLPVHTHLTRFNNSEKFNIPIIHKTISQKQFFYQSIVAWNDLPSHFKLITDNSRFSRELKKYLFSLV